MLMYLLTLNFICVVQRQNFFDQQELKRMSSVMPLNFNAMELCVVTMNEKPWVHAREVCRALQYQKGRARDVLKTYVSIENKQHKHELEGPAAVTPVD